MGRWWMWLLAVLAALGALVWYGALDARVPATADGVFDVGAYRALVAQDAPETLPGEVRVEFVGGSSAPRFGVEAGALSGEQRLTYAAFQIVAPGGATIIDGAVDLTTARGSSRADPRAPRSRDGGRAPS